MGENGCSDSAMQARRFSMREVGSYWDGVATQVPQYAGDSEEVTRFGAQEMDGNSEGGQGMATGPGNEVMIHLEKVPEPIPLSPCVDAVGAWVHSERAGRSCSRCCVLAC